MTFNEDGTVDLPWSAIDRVRDLAFDRDFGDVPLASLAPDAVVGVVRGGVIPATILSHQLDVRMFTINYSARQEQFKHVPLVDFSSEKYRRIVVVDDIADNGYTLKNIRDSLTEQGFCVFTAALVYKPESIYKPDYVRYFLPPESGWVTFSWEVADQPKEQRGYIAC